MTTNRKCAGCGCSMNLYRADAKACSVKCRVRVSRASKAPALPAAMTSRDRWVRRDARKRPLRVVGGMASSTDPATWSPYSAAVESGEGVGVGFVLGDGIGCYDYDEAIIDGVLAGWASDHISGIPERVIFTEISQSGEGVHVFIEAPEAKGTKIRDGRNIERYTAGRYIAVTGVPLSL